MALSTEQVALEAIKYVNSLPNEDGLIQFPGYARPITRKAAMNRAVRDIVKETGERSQTALLLEKLTGPDTKHFSGRRAVCERSPVSFTMSRTARVIAAVRVMGLA